MFFVVVVVYLPFSLTPSHGASLALLAGVGSGNEQLCSFAAPGGRRHDQRTPRSVSGSSFPLVSFSSSSS